MFFDQIFQYFLPKKAQIHTLYPFEIRGDSMFPTLKNLQQVKIRKILPYEKLQRGQIVVLTLDTSDKTDDQKLWQVKRIVGLPKEQIVFKRGKVWVKDTLKNTETELKEDYLGQVSSFKLGIQNYTETQKANQDFYEKICDEDQYYVLGDNRTSSQDSRHFGNIKRELIKYSLQILKM